VAAPTVVQAEPNSSGPSHEETCDKFVRAVRTLGEPGRRAVQSRRQRRHLQSRLGRRRFDPPRRGRGRLRLGRPRAAPDRRLANLKPHADAIGRAPGRATRLGTPPPVHIVYTSTTSYSHLSPHKQPTTLRAPALGGGSGSSHAEPEPTPARPRCSAGPGAKIGGRSTRLRSGATCYVRYRKQHARPTTRAYVEVAVTGSSAGRAGWRRGHGISISYVTATKRYLHLSPERRRMKRSQAKWPCTPPP
jgi:hypothetical protein